MKELKRNLETNEPGRAYRIVRWAALAVGVVGLSVLGASHVSSTASASGAAASTLVLVKANRYVGADKCKKCHAAKTKGGQHGKWKKMKHAEAFKVLGTKEAKELGKKAGVDNPQTSPKCLECHETAYGEAKNKLGRSFKDKLGVQCESCHGPGEKHFKARFKAEQAAQGGEGWDDDQAPAKIPAGELTPVTEKICKGCHNKKSPSFKDFKYLEKCKEISHLDPRKKKQRGDRPPCGK